MKIIIVFILLMLFATSSNSFSGDVNFINLPSAKTIETSRLFIAHRFFGNAGKDTFLGIDAGANVDLGFGAGIGNRLDLNFIRSRANKEYYLCSKYNIFEDETFGMSFLAGGTYKSDPIVTINKSSIIGQFIISKTFFSDKLIVNIVPSYALVARLGTSTLNHNDSAALGIAASFSKELGYSYFEKMEFIAEYIIPVYGYALAYPVSSAGIKIKTWGHYFSLLVGNSLSTLPNTYLAGSNDLEYHFGFNIARHF